MSEYELFKREIDREEEAERARWHSYCVMREEEERMKLIPVYVILLPGLAGAVLMGVLSWLGVI